MPSWAHHRPCQRPGDQPEQLVQRLAGAPRVLVGEKHDNPDHHALQLWLLRALQGQRVQGSLLLEMLQPEQQPLVDKVQGNPCRQTCPKRWPGRTVGIGNCTADSA